MLGFTESQESFIRDNLPEIQSVSERNIQYIDKNGTRENLYKRLYRDSNGLCLSKSRVGPDNSY